MGRGWLARRGPRLEQRHEPPGCWIRLFEITPRRRALLPPRTVTTEPPLGGQTSATFYRTWTPGSKLTSGKKSKGGRTRPDGFRLLFSVSLTLLLNLEPLV